MNIIFTAAGEGTRFHGSFKPLHKVHDKTLLEWSIQSLKIPGKYYVVIKDIFATEQLHATLSRIAHENSFAYLGIGPTSGQAESAYALASTLKGDDSLIVTNCDQYTPWDYKKFQTFVDSSDFDGIVTTYKHRDVVVGQPSRYSHIRLKDGRGVELAEKMAISEHSLNGIFYFRKTSDFLRGAEKLIAEPNKKESYMSLVYNYLIRDGKKIGIYEMQEHEFVSLGSLDEIRENSHRLPHDK